MTHAGGGTGAFGGAPYGATKRVRGVPNWVCGTHAGGSTGAFGGAPYGATKRVRGVPKWVLGDACGRQHWGLRWNSLWGHDENDGGDDQQESEKREAEEWHSETELRPTRTIEGRRTGGGDGRGGGKGATT